MPNYWRSTKTRRWSGCRRTSIPPERVLKSSVLIAHYTVRSERAFCEQSDYNLLFRWFLDMNLMEPSFDPAVFTKTDNACWSTGLDSRCSTKW